MKVYLTFDVEVWCNDWNELDQRFPAAFDRYVFGRSNRGDYALPKTLEILARNGLKGVFFVEPLFAARFGLEHLATVTQLIRAAGQDVQLHLHTEWVDELPAPPIADHHRKRQHLSYYTADEQQAIVGYGLELLRQVGVQAPVAFRAGSFACNRDTFHALAHHGLAFDSSLNGCVQVSAPDLRSLGVHEKPSWIGGVYSVPVATFRDGLGRKRSAQVNGSSFAELAQAMVSASQAGATDFVIVSHNFEMLKPGQSVPDPIVVDRFERLCRHLGRNRDALPTAVFSRADCHDRSPSPGTVNASTGFGPTFIRYAEQLRRRW